MKKKYETNQLLFTNVFILFLIYIIFIKILSCNYFTKYILISGVVKNDTTIDVFLTNREFKYLKDNHYVFIGDKKYKREIVEVNRNVFKEGRENYHELKIKIKLNKKYKVNDSIKLRVVEKKEKLYKIFKACWKEE